MLTFTSEDYFKRRRVLKDLHNECVLLSYGTLILNGDSVWVRLYADEEKKNSLVIVVE